jgi:hypothetical protein
MPARNCPVFFASSELASTNIVVPLYRTKLSPVAVTDTGLGMMLSFERSDRFFVLHEICIASMIKIINAASVRFCSILNIA